MKDRLQKFIELRPCVVEGEPGAHNVILKVTNQEFCIGHYASETKEEAEWMANMLVVALEKIVTKMSEKE
jgi:hypothetical protein